MPFLSLIAAAHRIPGAAHHAIIRYQNGQSYPPRLTRLRGTGLRSATAEHS